MAYKVDNSTFYVASPTEDGKELENRLEQESLTLKEEEEKKKKLEQELLMLKVGEAEKKKKLEQELLTLKKRELYRQCVSLVTMVPFTLYMAIELEKICSDQVLLGVISSALSHTILPFTALSLICTLYLIYNNRKIAQKEQELKSFENGEVIEKRKKSINDKFTDCLDHAEPVVLISVIVASIVSEALGQGIIEDVAFSISSLFYLITSVNFCCRECKKSKECERGKGQENSNFDEKFKQKMSAALMLAGSSILLIRRIILMASASSLSPAVGPTLGLIGMIFLIIGSGLAAYSYKKELKNIKVSGKGISTGAGGFSHIKNYHNQDLGPAIA